MKIKSSNLFFQANIGGIMTVILATLIFFFFRDVKLIPPVFIFFLCYIDIWIFKIAFEYQRITLTISRIAKSNNSNFSIPELQILMTDTSIALLLLLKSFLTGFLIGYFLLNSLIFLIIFLIFQYLLNIIIPAYIPYNLLFKLVNKEIRRKTPANADEYIEKIRLEKYFEEIPHTSNYGNWAFKKYGNELLRFK
jgi:hypothetical protein